MHWSEASYASSPFVMRQAKAKKVSKYDESRGVSESVDEGPLDDPLAEKLRLQKLVEQSDYQNAMELFGTGEPSWIAHVF